MTNLRPTRRKKPKPLTLFRTEQKKREKTWHELSNISVLFGTEANHVLKQRCFSMFESVFFTYDKEESLKMSLPKYDDSFISLTNV